MLRRLESIVVTIFFGAIPLLVSPLSRELFEFPKTIFLYFMTGVLLLVISFKSTIKIPSTKIFWIIGLIVVANIISTIFSDYHYTSLFGYYTRFNGGLVSILCILVWLIYLSEQLADKNKRDYVLLVIFLSGLVATIYALIQKIGIDKTFWTEDSSRRVFSTLGQPNWLAAYLIPLFYLALYFGLQQKKNIVLKILPATIIYIAIWFTYSISGIIALTFSLLILFLLNFNEGKKYFVKYWAILFIVLGITVAAAIPVQDRLKEQIKNMSGVIALLQSENPENFEPNYGDTGKIRIILWQGTANLILSSPKQFLVGSGPETFAYVFPRFRPNAINATSEAGFVHNKPHNWYLEIFSNLGLLGFIAYISFISANIYLFYKNEKTNLSKLLFSGWVGILITNLFGWPTVSLSILFFMLPIFFNVELLKTKTISINFSSMLGVSLIASFLICTSIIFAIADFHFEKDRYSQASKLNPFEARYQLFSIIYEEEWDPELILSFYRQNKYNPYVVKTLANYINYQLQLNPYPEKIIEVKNFVFEDAKKNSPADDQFK